MMIFHRDLLLFPFDLNSLLLEATPPLVLLFLAVGRIRRTVFFLDSNLRVIWDISTGFWGKGGVVCESGVR